MDMLKMILFTNFISIVLVIKGKKKFHSTKTHSHRFIPKFNMLEEKNYPQICGTVYQI